jgi:hypothetical protein
MGRPSKLDIPQKQQVVQLYVEEKLSTSKIAKQFNINPETVANILRANGQTLRTGPETNKLSTSFTFRELNEEKAFLLGIIYGDGSISIRQDYVNITSGDLDLLEKSQQILGNKFKITKVIDRNCYRGVIYSHKLCEELLELFQLTNNKSDKLMFPNIKTELMPFFISGYLATDGCIMVNKKSNTLRLIFYSCSKWHLESLNKYLCEKLHKLPLTLYERKNIKGHLGKKPLYILSFDSGSAEKACEYIFRNTTTKTRSDRKFSIYHNFITTKYHGAS